MSDDDIDLDRVLIDPAYRREVIKFLNAAAEGDGRDSKSAFAARGEAEPPRQS